MLTQRLLDLQQARESTEIKNQFAQHGPLRQEAVSHGLSKTSFTPITIERKDCLLDAKKQFTFLFIWVWHYSTSAQDVLQHEAYHHHRLRQYLALDCGTTSLSTNLFCEPLVDPLSGPAKQF
jgi:uncharacterized protein YjaZ